MKRLTILFASLLVLSAAAQNYKNEVTVTNAKELVEALGSDTRIILETGVYNISSVNTAETNEGITLIVEDENPYVILDGVSNMMLVSEEDAEIVVSNEFSSVLDFTDCSSIVIKGITLGHSTESFCFAPVLGFNYSRNILISECDLYGSGDVGISIYECTGITTEKSVIRDCTSEIAYIYRGNNINFFECEMKSTHGYIGIEISDFSEFIYLDHCTISNNSSSEGMPLIMVDETSSEIYVKYCTFENNKAYQLINYSPNIKLMDNTFSGNQFQEELDERMMD